MTQKSFFYLILFNAASIVRDPDQGNAALLNLHRNGRGPGVYGVFRKLLHHAGGPLYDFPGGDFIYSTLA